MRIRRRLVRPHAPVLETVNAVVRSEQAEEMPVGADGKAVGGGEMQGGRTIAHGLPQAGPATEVFKVADHGTRVFIGDHGSDCVLPTLRRVPPTGTGWVPAAAPTGIAPSACVVSSCLPFH